jgi:hypothetical protein
MEPAFDLFLSPHPDDIAYSAFSLLSERVRPRLCVVVFNRSRYTRLGLKPWAAVTLSRTLEDWFVMTLNHCTASYMFLPDSLVRPPGGQVDLGSRLLLSAGTPARIIAPLGVGNNSDHVLLRDFSIALWRKHRGAQLVLYEDMPYAARCTDLATEERSLVGSLRVDGLRAECIPMHEQDLRRKIFFSRLYITQSDKSDVLLTHARAVGACCGCAYAERRFATSPYAT